MTREKHFRYFAQKQHKFTRRLHQITPGSMDAPYLKRVGFELCYVCGGTVLRVPKTSNSDESEDKLPDVDYVNLYSLVRASTTTREKQNVTRELIGMQLVLGRSRAKLTLLKTNDIYFLCPCWMYMHLTSKSALRYAATTSCEHDEGAPSSCPLSWRLLSRRHTRRSLRHQHHEWF